MTSTKQQLTPEQAQEKTELTALFGDVVDKLCKWAELPKPTKFDCKFCHSTYYQSDDVAFEHCPPCRETMARMHNEANKRELERKAKLTEYVIDLLIARDKRAQLYKVFGMHISLEWLRAEYEDQELSTDCRHLIITEGRKRSKLLMKCNHCGDYTPRCGYAPVFHDFNRLILLCNQCYRKYGDNAGLVLAPGHLTQANATDVWDRDFYKKLALKELANRQGILFDNEASPRKVGVRGKGNHAGHGFHPRKVRKVA